MILRFRYPDGNYANSEVSSAFIPNIDLVTDPKLAPAFSCGLFSPTSSRVVVMHLKVPRLINGLKRAPYVPWPSDSCNAFGLGEPTHYRLVLDR